MNLNVLITGGAGYIGSITAHHLTRAGCAVVVLDDLGNGHRQSLAPEVPFYQGSVGDRTLISEILSKHNIQAVMHFAAFVSVEESVRHPYKYYHNNAVQTLELIHACVDSKRPLYFILSSTGAIYGNQSKSGSIREDAPLNPLNPYGWSKLMAERYLQDLASKQLKYTILRYFNAAGAAVDGSLGQMGSQATHLIKVACEHSCGKRDSVVICGTDYPTDDGTCIRDYIHVEDLVQAHWLALQALVRGAPNNIYNCGYGQGYSVRQVLHQLAQIAGRPLHVVEGPRRVGDAVSLVADSTKIQKHLGWKPRYHDLSVICQTALDWEKKLKT